MSLDQENTPSLIFKFKFDPQQARFNEFGQPEVIKRGHAGQHPEINQIASSYIELLPDTHTRFGEGEKLYVAPEVTVNGRKAIDFQSLELVKPEEVAFRIPLSQIKRGTYQWLRVAIAYQNFNIKLNFNDLETDGTIAAFTAHNNYITNFPVKEQVLQIQGVKRQGFWACETFYSVNQGHCSKTTVPNPIHNTSPIPNHSPVITGQFSSVLEINGHEKEDITVIVSLSTNNSFEWKDDNHNGIWEPSLDETPLDLGIRGLEAIIN